MRLSTSQLAISKIGSKEKWRLLVLWACFGLGAKTLASESGDRSTKLAGELMGLLNKEHRFPLACMATNKFAVTLLAT